LSIRTCHHHENANKPINWAKKAAPVYSQNLLFKFGSIDH
jgi:hypothetical protein